MAGSQRAASPGYGIVANADGSVTRLPLPKLPPTPHSFADGAASKDITLHAPSGLWARLFLPAPRPSASSKAQLPLLLYFHGGGFVMMSVAYKFYHKFFLKLCTEARIIIVAVEYRLAPEHRLPAAHQDAWASLQWLRSQALSCEQQKPHGSHSSAEPWLIDFADFSQCYLMGDSSGGNMVHHLSVKIAESDISPLCVRGQIIVQPFFGGLVRTATELRLADDSHVPLAGTDWLWRTALPIGACRDDPLANPIGPLSPDYKTLSNRLPTTLFMVATGDPMQERQVQLFQRLKEAGVQVHLLSYEGSHGFQLQRGSTTEVFIKDVVDFLNRPTMFSSKL